MDKEVSYPIIGRFLSGKEDKDCPHTRLGTRTEELDGYIHALIDSK